MVHHALGPGTGVPSQLALDDCAARSNLDGTQARPIGARLGPCCSEGLKTRGAGAISDAAYRWVAGT